MAEQYPKLVNKQYNSPIQLYSDRNVREILERETKVLANGAIGIDFNNPISNKPANLQNSAVLRMLEEEENRKRSGQPGSLKRVAWPPPSDSEEFVEQEPVQSQGGPQYSSKSESSAQNNQAQLQQPLTSPAFQQQSQQPKSPITTNNTFEPIISPTATSSLSGAQSPYQSAPLSPNISKSPVSFLKLAKPWSPQGRSTPQFKPVQPPSLRTVQSYHSSEQYQYQSQDKIRETQTVISPFNEQAHHTSVQETTFQQYQTPPIVEHQSSYEVIKTQQEQRSFPRTEFSARNVTENIQETVVEVPKPVITPTGARTTIIPIQQEGPKSETFKVFQESTKVTQEIPKSVIPPPSPRTTIIPIQQEGPKSEPLKVFQEPTKVTQEVPKPVITPPSPRTTIIPIQQEGPKSETPKVFQEPIKLTQELPKPVTKIALTKTLATEQVTSPPIQSQPSAAAQGIAQNQIPAQPRYQPAPVKQVEPPPSTITLRPQAPVSQAPPPLVTSQPATATLRGGKHLRGDLKWPPENVRERMVAEEHHLEELAKGPALRPRKNCKDYSAFFAKHALGHVYPGYKIPPGTQYYDHNPVM